MTARCETCGQFVPARQLRTIRRYYDIDHSMPVAVYSLATATKFQSRLDCPSCSMDCCLMDEAERGYGVAVGSSLPNGWEQCSPQATQADYEMKEPAWT